MPLVVWQRCLCPIAQKAADNLYQRQRASLDQLAAEYNLPANGYFDRFVNVLNRLPRPTLALGTVGLFVHAMIDPIGFSYRMQGLAAVPDPLWWLLGAVVSFYFGARELHYSRRGQSAGIVKKLRSMGREQSIKELNPALQEWNQR